MTTNITSDVRSLSRKGDKTVVQVEVTGAIGDITDSFMRQRARARALLASNVLDTAVNTVGDVAMGDLRRLTVITGFEKDKKQVTSIPKFGTIFQTKVYTVEVNTGD